MTPPHHGTIRDLHHLLHVCLLYLLVCTYSVTCLRPSWWSCVRDIGVYFAPKSDTQHEWKPNPCGFTSLTVENVRSQVYFAKNNATISFAGDSTALRAYVFAVNTYLPPLNIPVIKKVATVPRVMTHLAHGEYGGQTRSAFATFFNMRYVSTSKREIEEGIMQSDGGVMVITIGNWDLNWKLQKNSPMPNLKGPVHNLEVAKAYWTDNVQAMIETIARCLASQVPSKRPLIVFREQFLPNCAASRFTSKKARYRRCAPLIRPIVVPLYRRVLAPAAWSLNIPVIPMDHVFKDNYRYCGMGDGIHLDFNCMMTEQQHVWNVVMLMQRHKVKQGLGTTQHEGSSIPNVRSYLNETKFEEWRRAMDMVPPQAGSIGAAFIAAGDGDGVGTDIDPADNQTAIDHNHTAHMSSITSTTGGNNLIVEFPPNTAVFEESTAPPVTHDEIVLTLEIRDAPNVTNAQHQRIYLSMDWSRWGWLLWWTLLLVAVVWYFWRYTSTSGNGRWCDDLVRLESA